MNNFEKFKEEKKKLIDNMSIDEVAEYIYNSITLETVKNFLNKDEDEHNCNYGEVIETVKNLSGEKISTRKCVICGKLKREVEK